MTRQSDIRDAINDLEREDVLAVLEELQALPAGAPAIVRNTADELLALTSYGAELTAGEAATAVRARLSDLEASS